MDYQGTVIRPPSEADSIILQVTVGCSHNRCTFCGAYKGERFRYKDQAIIDQDLHQAARLLSAKTRLFLADGDVLIIPQHRLVPLLKTIRRRLPQVRRIRLYGNRKSIAGKSPTELAELKKLGLDRIYMGLESGDDEVLAAIRKGSTAEQMIIAGKKVREAGIFLSVTVLLGIGGLDRSQQHALATARVLNFMRPNQIAALTLMPMAGTPLHDQIRQGDFTLPDELALLRELQTMLQHLELDKVQFQANHASNFLPLDCRLQRDKAATMTMITKALAGDIPLMPDYLRGL
jgi:radical SAM superfamily enzyme YgiQ (UPF0313 family)